MKAEHKQIRYFLQMLVHLQKHRLARGQDGYAMLITSILAILLFSMLSVYLFSANLYKSVASAVVDNGTTFYAAESGMNSRANLVRSKFEGFSQPSGISPANNSMDVVAQMQQCIANRGATDNATTVGTGDFRCLDTSFDYKEPGWKSSGNNYFIESNKSDPSIKYRAYSFIRQLTGAVPNITKVPAGEPYAGLNMQEYKYRVYATAQKESQGYMPVGAQTLLQMDFNSRVIPLFQFAAFYEGDMEVTSSSDMSLNGPLHSNGNVYLAPGGTLRAGQVSAAAKEISPGNWSGGKIYKSLDRRATFGGLTPGYRFILGNNAPIDVSLAWTNAGINTQVSAADIAASNGLLQPGSPRLEIPKPDFLNRAGNYFTKADLRVTFDPSNAAQPFSVQSLQTVLPSPTVTTTFSSAMVKSLRQPVMLVTQAHRSENKSVSLNTTEWNNLCVGNGANFTSTAFSNTLTPTSLNGWSLANATTASDALRRAIAKSNTIYTYSQLNNNNMNSTGSSGLNTTLRPLFQTELNATTLTTAQKNTLLGSVKPREIANKAGNCFLPAPMRILTNQVDRQEDRNMTILQSNIHSLTIWNRDGQYSDDGTNVLSAASKVFARKPDIDTAISNGIPEASIPVGSYEWMGLGASDTTEGGLVWHFSVDPSYTYPAGQSPYGFGLSGGRWLPGPLTLATDQIAYVQGDLNNPGGVQPATIGEDVFSGNGNAGAGISRAENLRHKKPAAVMADAIGILSNTCVDGEGSFNCFNVNNNTPLPFATTTSVNAAFLAGTLKEAGLNNYMRMMENWGGSSGGTLFRYRGSFVSLGSPQKLSGGYLPSSSQNATTNNYYVIPGRDFGYDNSFDSVAGLPPLTPQVVYLKQKVFKRDYNSSRN